MYKRKFRVIVFITLLTILTMPCLAACKGAPLASFTAGTVSGEAPLVVTFTNTSENADEFYWEFGDGASQTTSTIEETVSHEYTQTGQHTAKLTASRSDNPSETSVMEVNINITPGPLTEVRVMPESAEVDIGGTQEFSVSCTDAYGNEITDYQLSWDVSLGIGSMDLDIFTAGTKAGVFTEAVTATVKSGDTVVSGTTSVTIKPDPLDSVSIVPVQLAAGEELQLEFIATDEYGNTIDGLESFWSMINESAGTVNEQGLFTAARLAENYPEAVKVEVTQGDNTVHSIADVVIIPGPLEQAGLAPEVVNVGIGMTQQMVAAGADRFGNRIPDLVFNWNIEPDAGTITDGGMFTANDNPGEYKDAISVEIIQGSITRSVSCDINIFQDRILFLSNRNHEEEMIFDYYIMNSDGTDQEFLVSANIAEPGIPSCSPDGRRILFHDDENINIFNVNGTWFSIFLAGRAAGEPSWSPDGTKIVFQSWEHYPAEIYIMDIDGSNLIRLTNNTYYDDYPRWSPDGQKIVFISNRDGDNDIYIMNADGSNQQCPINTPVMELFPQWSPDGTEIIFQSHAIGGQTWGIYIMNVDGSNRRLLRDDAFVPFWSPDGSKIVFYSFPGDDSAEIFIMDRDGSKIVQLTDHSAMDFVPVWLPRMRGVSVTEESVVIPDISFGLPRMEIEDITTMAGKATVRIETDLGSGTGFIINSSGIILTNNHVISDAEEITVYLADGTNYDGEVLGRDMVHDIAVVKIEAEDLPYLEMAELGTVNPGQQVIVLGYPLGKENVSVTSGLVSTTEYDIGRNIVWIQTDSAINPGNSGGPMLNLQGQVIGMVSAKLVGISVEGVGFAISTNTVLTFLDRLLDREIIDSFE